LQCGLLRTYKFTYLLDGGLAEVGCHFCMYDIILDPLLWVCRGCKAFSLRGLSHYPLTRSSDSGLRWGAPPTDTRFRLSLRARHGLERASSLFKSFRRPCTLRYVTVNPTVLLICRELGWSPFFPAS